MSDYDETDKPAASSEREAPRRPIRSYVLRQGRLTPAQQHALDSYWPDMGIDFSQATLTPQTVFGNDHPVIVEVGFGNGESLLEQAKRHPEQNFIGIEVHGPGVGHLMYLAHGAGISNLRVMRHDAVEVLAQQFPDACIDTLQLFFPDPWHKKKHNKRRIVNPRFIDVVRRVLKPGGQFHLATDWQHYAEQMLQQMEQAEGFSNSSGAGNFADHRGERTETRFEKRGKRLGHGVWDLFYQRL